MDAEDVAVLDSAQAGSAPAFTVLMHAHERPMWAVCLRIAGNRDDAQVAMQQALVAAWQNLDKLHDPAKLGSWLYRIASNAALAAVRQRRERTVVNIAGATESAADSGRSAECEVVQAALRRLPDALREALVLRECGNLTDSEIAAHQHIPEASVQSRLDRSRRMLISELQRTAVSV